MSFALNVIIVPVKVETSIQRLDEVDSLRQGSHKGFTSSMFTYDLTWKINPKFKLEMLSADLQTDPTIYFILNHSCNTCYFHDYK